MNGSFFCNDTHRLYYCRIKHLNMQVIYVHTTVNALLNYGTRDFLLFLRYTQLFLCSLSFLPGFSMRSSHLTGKKYIFQYFQTMIFQNYLPVVIWFHTWKLFTSVLFSCMTHAAWVLIANWCCILSVYYYMY